MTSERFQNQFDPTFLDLEDTKCWLVGITFSPNNRLCFTNTAEISWPFLSLCCIELLGSRYREAKKGRISTLAAKACGTLILF